MGEYYDWINIDKKEYICPSFFDHGSKFHESIGRDGNLLCALRTLLDDEWKNCRIAWIGDECSIPKDYKIPFFENLNKSINGRGYGNIFDGYLEIYKNASGLFKITEDEVRHECEWHLEDVKAGIKDCLDEFGIDGKEDPFDGMFQKEGMMFEYTINYTKKICYSFNKTKILQLDGSENDWADPLPILMGYGRMQPEPGEWLGDIIGVSNEIDDSIKILDHIYLDW